MIHLTLNALHETIILMLQLMLKVETTFPGLDVATLNSDAALKTAFQTDVKAAVAASANVDPSQVTILAIVAGSVVVRPMHSRISALRFCATV